MKAILIFISLALLVPSSFAANILLFGDRSEMSQLQTDLTNLGHSVTNTGNSLSGDLSSFDSIWGVRISSVYDVNPLANYIQSGGRVYLTGENAGFTTVNGSISSLITTLTGESYTLGANASSDTASVFNSGALGNITSAPNTITNLNIAAGGHITTLDNENILLRALGNPVGAVFDESDMLSGQGRLVTILDVNWLAASRNADNVRLPVIENIQTFLTGDPVSSPVPEPSSIILCLLSGSFLLLSKRR